MNKGVGIASSMFSAISNIGNTVGSKFSLKEDIAKTCEMDYSPAAKEATKLINILDAAKSLAEETKEMTENAKCLDGLLAEESKEHQTALFESLKKSRETLKTTSQLINDLECSASSSNFVHSVKKSILGMFKHLYLKEFGMFCCGLGIGGSTGYIAGYALKRFKESKSEHDN